MVLLYKKWKPLKGDTTISLFFLLLLQGFRAAAEQQIEAGKRTDTNSGVDLESLRKAAMIIFNQYLSEKVRF